MTEQEVHNHALSLGFSEADARRIAKARKDIIQKKLAYSYDNMTDKSKEGFRKEVIDGIYTMAVYYYTTHGLPFDYFKELLDQKVPHDLGRFELYMKFRNQHPELYA